MGAIETLERAAELGAANELAIDTFLQGIPRKKAAAGGAEVGNGKAGIKEAAGKGALLRRPSPRAKNNVAQHAEQ